MALNYWFFTSISGHKWNLDSHGILILGGQMGIRGEIIFLNCVCFPDLSIVCYVSLGMKTSKHYVEEADNFLERGFIWSIMTAFFRSVFWVLRQTLGILNSYCIPSLSCNPPLPDISPLYTLSFTASSLFLAESQQLAGTYRVILYVTQNPLCWLPWCFKRGAVAAAAEHPGYSGRALLWSLAASDWQEPGAAQRSKIAG